MIYDPYAFEQRERSAFHTLDPVEHYLPVHSRAGDKWFVTNLHTGRSVKLSRLEERDIAKRVWEEIETHELTEALQGWCDFLENGEPHRTLLTEGVAPISAACKEAMSVFGFNPVTRAARYCSSRYSVETVARALQHVREPIPELLYEGITVLRLSDLDDGVPIPEGAEVILTEGFKFIDRLRIKPQKRSPSHSACSFGKSAKDGKWYGWSHRAYQGFGVGDLEFKELPYREFQKRFLTQTVGGDDDTGSLDHYERENREYLKRNPKKRIRTDAEARESAIRFADSGS